MMLNPVINWFGSHDEAALFRRFLIQTLGYDMKATGDVLMLLVKKKTRWLLELLDTETI